MKIQNKYRKLEVIKRKKHNWQETAESNTSALENFKLLPVGTAVMDNNGGKIKNILTDGKRALKVGVTVEMRREIDLMQLMESARKHNKIKIKTL